MDLTPEERRRIYEEEKAGIEAERSQTPGLFPKEYTLADEARVIWARIPGRHKAVVIGLAVILLPGIIILAISGSGTPDRQTRAVGISPSPPPPRPRSLPRRNCPRPRA